MDKNSNFQEIVERAMAIRQQYHQLERELHQEEWNLIEDALAFMTDASLVGRNIMSISNRWPNQDDKNILRHKIGECIWWLIVLSERSGIDVIEAVHEFLQKTERAVGPGPTTGRRQ